MAQSRRAYYKELKKVIDNADEIFEDSYKSGAHLRLLSNDVFDDKEF